jgi:sulfur-carrier protein adenylyltransferase/sulfurtransferase
MTLDAKISQIAQRALRSPSGDNCQPWRLGWRGLGGSGLEIDIHHDEKRGRHSLNVHNHASYLALGMLLESVRIAASDFGLSTSWVTPLEGGDLGHWATLRLVPEELAPDPLGPALTRRWTERRPFRKGTLDDALRTACLAEVARFGSARLRFGSLEGELREYLVQAETLVWSHPNWQRDLMAWIRFSRREEQSTLDGMPWRTLGINRAVSWVLKACRNYKVQQIMNRLGFLSTARRQVAQQLDSASALFALTTRGEGPEALVEVGAAAQRVWLRLNQSGFGVQPLTLSSLLPYSLRSGAPEAAPSPRAEQVLRRGTRILPAAFGLAADEQVVWVFRTGPSEAPRHVTLRLPLGQVLHKEGL